MSYLVTQIWLMLLLSFVLGSVFGWLLKGWRSHKLAVALLDARARHAADATETARQRSELGELRERGKKFEADLQALRASAADLVSLRAQLAERDQQLERLTERLADLEAEKAAAGAHAAELEARALVLHADLEQTRERLRHDSLALASTRHELARVQERLRHVPVAQAGPSDLLPPAGADALTNAALAPDDLEKIVGVGPKLKGLLHSLGIHHYAQIAHWTDADVDQAAAQLPGFGSRIRRDDWRGQARVLHQLKYGSEI